MKYKVLLFASICFLIGVFNNMTAFANSSWHWVTTSPMTILPIAVILTLMVEAFGIKRFNHIKNTPKVFVTVTLANIVSFVLPYLLRVDELMKMGFGYFDAIYGAFDKGPFYMVMLAYLLLTLIVEVPIVFLLMKREVENKKRLVVTILIVNTVTTIMVAVLERIICRGHW